MLNTRVPAGWLPWIRKTNITHKNRLHFVRSVWHSLGVNQAQAARSEIPVPARVPLIVDRFTTRTGHITTSMVSTKYPKSEVFVSHTKGLLAAPRASEGPKALKQPALMTGPSCHTIRHDDVTHITDLPCRRVWVIPRIGPRCSWRFSNPPPTRMALTD
jgi:hypothetical protein